MNGKAFTILNTSCLADNEVQTFQEREENQYIKKNPKVAHSVALRLAFLTSENENLQLEDLPLADFGRLLERLLLSVRTKSINKNFVN